MAFEANNTRSGEKQHRKAAPVRWLKSIWNFIVDSKNEMKRITWPEKKDVYKSTEVVISTVIILTLFVLLLDSIFGRSLNYFINAIK
ncbi:MAG: preprotein translocase subunit SecE [Clostridiales bacterium]|nr:preprotein translocase subunit SecE [Clostridiales bacterium]HBM79912.1 preprotein translocase subunit SecE [Clostridiaceae bacterium]